jgi:hypothetical protein
MLLFQVFTKHDKHTQTLNVNPMPLALATRSMSPGSNSYMTHVFALCYCMKGHFDCISGVLAFISNSMSALREGDAAEAPIEIDRAGAFADCHRISDIPMRLSKLSLCRELPHLSSRR